MDKLFNLIRSLSAKEKKQYVKYARQHLSKKEAHKVQLFQLINKQINGQLKDYQAFAKRQFSATSLPSLKTQLYNQILTSLSHQSVDSARSRVSQMIDEIQLLMDRGLLKQALSRIEKAKKIIEGNHLHFQFLELSLLHRRIIRQFKTRDVIILLEEEQAECNQRLNFLKKEFDLLELYERQFLHNRINTAGEGQAPKLQKPTSKEKKIGSFEGKMYHHLLWRQYFRNKFRESGNKKFNPLILQETKAMLHLFDDNPNIKIQNLPRYFLVHYIYLNANIYLGNFETVLLAIDQLKNISAKNFYQEAQKESIILQLESILYFQMQQFEKVKPIAERALIVFEKYKVFISFERALSTTYNFGVSLFLAGELDSAWDAFNYCLEKKDYSELKEKVVGKSFGKYVHASAHLFRLITVQAKNEEEDYTDLLYSLVASTQHYLKQHKIEDPILWSVFQYLRKVVNKNIHQKELLTTLHQELKTKLAYKEYAYWAEQVLEK